jgi:hypothetical protein
MAIPLICTQKLFLTLYLFLKLSLTNADVNLRSRFSCNRQQVNELLYFGTIAA